MTEEQTDPDLKEAIEACTHVIEEKCKKRPYMIIISKANVGFASEEDKEKGKLIGNASYMYVSKPPVAGHTISKLLISASKKAIELAEQRSEEAAKKVAEKQAKQQ